MHKVPFANRVFQCSLYVYIDYIYYIIYAQTNLFLTQDQTLDTSHLLPYKMFILLGAVLRVFFMFLVIG